jgi:hypothetical protein
MTSLEKFLTKRQDPKSAPDSKPQTKDLVLASNDLPATISNLKSIFPHESDESLMLLALQYQNPADLEAVVHKILEDEGNLSSFSSSWNTVKTRDKKKPEEKRKGKFKKQNKDERPENKEYEEQNYGKGYKGEGYGRGQYKRGVYYEARKPETRKKEPGGQETQAVKVETTEKVESRLENAAETVLQEERKNEEKKLEEFPRLAGSDKKVIDYWSGVVDEYEQPPGEIQDNSYAHRAPEVIIPHENSGDNKIPEEVSEKVLFQAFSEQSPKERSNKPDNKGFNHEKKGNEVTVSICKKDAEVQVDFDYGIPIIIYPYMFKRT